MASLTTIVLIHGAFHGPSCWHKVSPLLEKSGYRVICVTLPSAHASPPLEFIDPDIAAIRSAVEVEVSKGRAVILNTHSYSGLPGNAALTGLLRPEREQAGSPGGVIAMTMMSSYALLENEQLGAVDEPLELTVAEDGLTGTIAPELAVRYFYGDLPRAEAEECAAALRPHSLVTFGATMPTRVAWRDVPLHYLICTRDEAVLEERQRYMVERVIREKDRKEVVVEECESGHSPMLSQPEVVAAFLKRAAGEVVLD